jgi:thiamine biosynthesis lipoprotein
LAGVLATSGDYATTFTPDFKTNHIFDPGTLRSPQRMASASVIAKSGAYADALATAMMIMEPEASLALAQQVGADVLLMDKQGQITRTAGFPLA